MERTEMMSPNRIIDFVGHPKRAAYIVLGIAIVLTISLGFNIDQWSSKHQEEARIIRRNCQSIELLKKISADQLGLQIKRSQAFLEAHPDGIPGIPAYLLKQSIDDAKNVFGKLAPKTC